MRSAGSTLRAAYVGMVRIGVRELRQHASRYLALVKDGETVGVTERGRPVAKLVPTRDADTAQERLIAAGRLIPASRPFSPPGAVRAPAGAADTSTVLEELREERL